MQKQTFCDKKQSPVGQPQRPPQAHRTECKADETGLCRSDCLVPSPSLRLGRSPHGSCCTFKGGVGNSRFSHQQGTRLEHSKLRTWRDPVPQRGLLTWEPIVIKITQVGNALPKMCIVGTISSQGQLFLKGSLGNRMEVEGKKKGGKNKHNENSELRTPPSQGTSTGRKQLGRNMGTQISFLTAKEKKPFTYAVGVCKQPEIGFRKKIMAGGLNITWPNSDRQAFPLCVPTVSFFSAHPSTPVFQDRVSL